MAVVRDFSERLADLVPRRGGGDRIRASHLFHLIAISQERGRILSCCAKTHSEAKRTHDDV